MKSGFWQIIDGIFKLKMKMMKNETQNGSFDEKWLCNNVRIKKSGESRRHYSSLNQANDFLLVQLKCGNEFRPDFSDSLSSLILWISFCLEILLT